MKKGKKAVEIDVLFHKTRSVVPVLNVPLVVHRTHVAQDELVPLTSVAPLTVRYHCVHPELSVLVLLNEVRPHCRSDDVGNVGPPFGKVRGEVHLFPTVFLLYQLHTGEAKVLAHTLSSHKVNHAV